MKILILILLLISTALPQNNMLLFYLDSGVTADVTAPDEVQNLVAVARTEWQINRTGTMVLIWDAETDTNVRQRTIYRSTTANPTIADSITTLAKAIYTYVDSGITSNIYHYRIVSIDWAGNRSGYSANVSDTVYEFEVSRYLAASPNELSNTNKQLINNFVKARKDSLGIDSLSQAYDVLYLFANQDSVTSKLNLVKRAHDCVNVDSMTFTQYQGWNGDVTGGNNYLNTKYSCYTDSVNFARHNFGVGIYVQQTTGYSGVDFGAGIGSLDIRGRVRNTGDQYYYKMIDAVGAAPSPSLNAAGWTVFERPSTTTTGIYKNGVISIAIGTGFTTNYTSNITQNIYIGCYNATGVASFFTPRIYSVFAVRRSFSASENSAEKTDIEAYLDALGVGVIP